MKFHQKDYHPRLYKNIVEKVYIPKYKTKSLAPNIFYQGENELNHWKYQTSHANKSFSTKNQKEEYILGIESTFDDCSFSLVSNKGKIKALCSESDRKNRMLNQGIDPLKAAKEHHAIQLPLLRKKVF